MHEFIKKSTEDELPVCLDIEADPDTQKETLTVSNEEDCQ